MKAVVYTRYGSPDVLNVIDIPKPEPMAGEVLIQVHYSTVNRTDCGMRGANYFVSRFVTGLLKPKYTTTGSEFAGQIVAVGQGVTDYAIGDKVFGFDDVRAGAHAEFVVKKASGSFAVIPEGYSYEQMASAGEGATYALNVINAAKITKGQKVMVYGASGAIGSAAVQILKHMGADVTAVCGTSTISKVKTLGADRVIDYQTQDFTARSDRYDLVFDAVGKSSYGVCKKLLTPKGIYYSSELGKGGQNPLLAIWFAITGSHKVIFPIPRITKAVILQISGIIAAGDFEPLVDRTYDLKDIRQAATYVESGQKVGNVLIKVPVL